MSYENVSTNELVANLIGEDAAKHLSTDSLHALFAPETPDRGLL
jgi:hypothetical protein